MIKSGEGQREIEREIEILGKKRTIGVHTLSVWPGPSGETQRT